MDLGVGGISYVELLILYELWAGDRLSLEKAHPRYLRPGRPISVSAVPFGSGIDVWRSCRFGGAMMRSSSLAAWRGLVGLCLALLVLPIADFVILGGRSVVMDLPRDHERVLRWLSWMSCCCSFSILQDLLVRFLLVHFHLKYCAAQIC